MSVGSEAVVVLGESSGTGYDEYNYFMGAVGCFREEGKVCFEGIPVCFLRDHVYAATSAAAPLHTIGTLAWRLERFFKERAEDRAEGREREPLGMMGLPVQGLLDVITSRLMWASLSYLEGVESTSPEAGRLRAFMAGVRSRVEMMTYVQPWCWHWASEITGLEGIPYMAEGLPVEENLLRTTRELAHEVGRVCFEPFGSTRCRSIKERLLGLSSKVLPVIDAFDSQEAVPEGQVLRAVEAFVDALADATGAASELGDGLADLAMDALLQARQSVGKCVAAMVLRNALSWESLRRIVEVQQMRIVDSNGVFNETVGKSAEGVAYQVATLQGFLVRFLLLSKAAAGRRPYELGVDLKSIAQGLQAYSYLAYKDRIPKVFLGRLFSHAVKKPGVGEEGVMRALDVLRAKADALERLLKERQEDEAAIAKGWRPLKPCELLGLKSEHPEDWKALAKAGHKMQTQELEALWKKHPEDETAIIEASLEVQEWARVLTRMAVEGGATGFVRNELLLISG